MEQSHHLTSGFHRARLNHYGLDNVLDNVRVSTDCATTRFISPSLKQLSAPLGREYLLSLFLTEADRSCIDLHRVDQACQEVRQWNSIMLPIFKRSLRVDFQNKAPCTNSVFYSTTMSEILPMNTLKGPIS